MLRFVKTAVLASVAIASTIAVAQAETSTPKAYQGTWGLKGNCSDPGSKLVIHAHTIALGTAKPEKSVYDSGSGPGARGGLNFDDDTDASGFAINSADGTLAFHPEGWDMGGVQIYKRCN
ncbi:hypothetical protein HGP16_31680 [Rhizobium sp. P40RR-XXII]|uniref:hypothetical protein n=1 Tax=unclassified Rhizobium TaxID=2613769 RepID=UPI0014566093|nr:MULTISPECIES: hypothetical protein [unclassified Rhizobium]NLR89119.1 hypothetical protein [Rhizobium sp. P28RR-XV]NLS21062.1 hypothetical protein [Rhizobium sp. P40RR-XXII]